MIGIDTNILVRYLVQDDEHQFAQALAIIRREARSGAPVLISLVVLLETEWVLRSRYGIGKPDVLTAIVSLLQSHDFAFESEHSVEEAIHLWKESHTDFADCLIGSHYRRLGCRTTVTFDNATSKLPGFSAVRD
jgi:predicted nucleic-acid-binding protein